MSEGREIVYRTLDVSDSAFPRVRRWSTLERAAAYAAKRRHARVQSKPRGACDHCSWRDVAGVFDPSRPEFRVELLDLIAEADDEHLPKASGTDGTLCWIHCKCGWITEAELAATTKRNYRDHRAEAVLDALQITPLEIMNGETGEREPFIWLGGPVFRLGVTAK